MTCGINCFGNGGQVRHVPDHLSLLCLVILFSQGLIPLYTKALELLHFDPNGNSRKLFLSLVFRWGNSSRRLCDSGNISQETSRLKINIRSPKVKSCILKGHITKSCRNIIIEWKCLCNYSSRFDHWVPKLNNRHCRKQ